MSPWPARAGETRGETPTTKSFHRGRRGEQRATEEQPLFPNSSVFSSFLAQRYCPPRRAWVDSSRGLARDVFWPTPGRDPYKFAPRQGCGEYLHTDLSGTPAGVHVFRTPTGGTRQNSRRVPPATIHPHPPGWEDRTTKKLLMARRKQKTVVQIIPGNISVF